MSIRGRKGPSKVLVVAHDAGGAEIIGAYILYALKSRKGITCYGNGPALHVFRRLRIPMRRLSDRREDIVRVLSKQPRGTVLLASAPGWMSKLEIRALEEAKRLKMYTCIYMDSWIDERRRFGFPKPGWEKRLPDEFWVGDRYAYKKTSNSFQNRRVRLVPNLYHANQMHKYKIGRQDQCKSRKILFVSQASYRGVGAGNARLLREMLRVLSKQKRDVVVRIRLHPADAIDRYDALVSEYKQKVPIEISTERDVVKDLLQAIIVVGTETDVLALATLCGITAISYVKNGLKPVIPHESIKRISDVQQIGQLMSRVMSQSR